MDDLDRIIDDGEQLRQDIKINDSSPHTLNEEMKRQTQLQVEIALLARYAKIKYNRLLVEEEILVAKLTNAICKKAEENGKGIASSAKDKLKKTDIPLSSRYQELKRELLQAEEEVEFLKSLQYILSQRGDLLIEIVKNDKGRMMADAMLNTDAGMKARMSLYNKKLREMKPDLFAKREAKESTE